MDAIALFELLSMIKWLVAVFFIFVWPCMIIAFCGYDFIFNFAKRKNKKKYLGKPTMHESDRTAYTFEWKVENLSYCWLKREENIISPTFTAHALDDTKWSLTLNFKGETRSLKIIVSYVFLNRKEDFGGAKVIRVKYELVFLNKDGSILINSGVCELNGDKHDVYWPLFLLTSPVDTLTIQCKIWKYDDEEPVESKRLYARTILKGQRGSFIWKIDKFSLRTLTSGLIGNFVVINKSDDILINFDLIQDKIEDSKKEFLINILSSDNCIDYFAFKASLLDRKGRKKLLGNEENFDTNLKKDKSFRLSFTNDLLMENRNLYMPNDVLSIECEYALSDGTVTSECTSCGTISSSDIQDADKHQAAPVIMDDLKSMYTSSILCDAELRTSIRKFPAHKVILSARSTVFRKMFSSDMKEKNSGHVDIVDFDDETVDQMLTYIYTDSVEYRGMKRTSKLYTAADKYDIPSLKRRCASFLKDNLCPETACDVLVLADMHRDHDLEIAVQDFILDHRKVFDTEEWKNLMATKIHVAAEIMYLKISQNM